LKILVTGGAGFIGSAVCRWLHASTDCEIVNLDKLTYAASPASLEAVQPSPRYAFVQADVADADAVRAVFAAHRPDAVMHLAAESHVDRSISGPGDFITTNIVGTYTLLQAALDYWSGLPAGPKAAFRLLHVSTDEVFGSLGEAGLFTETTPYDPRSPYSASKAASDHLVSAWGHTYGLPVVISNCSNNYGPHQFPEKLIPLVILNAVEAKPLPIYGDGGNIRDWLFVDDHARALHTILREGRPGRTYNVGGANERTNLQVVEAICGLLDEMRPGPRPHRELIAFVADRPGHDRRYAIDASRIADELGWRPLETFETGLRKTVRWYLDNPGWWRPLRDRYAGERLGLAARRVSAD